MKLFYTLFVLLSFQQINHAQTNVLSQAKKDSMEKYIIYLESKNALIGSVGIFENGKPVYKRNFGQAALGKTEKRSTTIKYQIGSISKLFTAVMFARLEEQKKIDFGEPLSNYFTDMPNANKITIRQMLNHTSGLKNYVVKNDTAYYWLSGKQKQEDIFKEIKRQGVLFSPGDSMSYSNSAYYLLARILEKKYKKDYASILYEQISMPLNLKNTTASSVTMPSSITTASYRKTNNTWNKIDEFYFLNASGVGDIISTTDDLNVFINALSNGKIISAASFEKMKPLAKEYFGMGIMKIPFHERVGLGHGGDTFGTHCVTGIFEDEKLSIAYCVNGESYLTNDFAKDILSILFNRPMKYPNFNNEVADTSQFIKIVGKYGSKDFPIAIKIFNEGKILMAQGDGQSAFELTKISENKFEFRQATIIIQFDPQSNSLSFTQAGKSFELFKIREDVLVSTPTLDVKRLSSHEGLYKSDEIPITITVFIENGSLKAQGSGQSPFPLSLIAENKFEFKEGGIIMIFNVDKRLMTLQQGGKDYKFQKE